MPFIGSNWQQSRYKTLLIGESHYVPMNELMDESPDYDFLNDWYGQNSSNFPEYLLDYINTRMVVDIAENIPKFQFRKPLTLYYNVKSVIKNELPELSSAPHVFPYFSFYNYFQRPAITEGDSIVNSDTDNKIAYATLKEIARIIKPEKIVFVSKRVFNAFHHEKFQNKGNPFFEGILIDIVPHPSCAWWNKPARAYGNKTGKEKFTEIVKGLK